MINLCQADLGIYTPEDLTVKNCYGHDTKNSTQTKNSYIIAINSVITSLST